ncbi:MAG: hypothetical protein R3E65_03415 [Steroidobacteraceae bacterium]
MVRDEQTLLNLRRDLALQIARHVRRARKSPAVMACRLGVAESTLRSILNGRVSSVSLEFLIRVAVRARLKFVLQVGRAPSEAGAFVQFARNGVRTKSQPSCAPTRSIVSALTPSERLAVQLRLSELLFQPNRVAGRDRCDTLG